MTKKAAKDYIAFPLDVASVHEAVHYVEMLSNWVGMFKVGLELFAQTGPEIVYIIKKSGAAKVFLDLKLHDIPETVYRTMMRIAEMGVEYTTVHCGESLRMLEAAVNGSGGDVSVLAVTVLTSITAEEIQASGFKEKFTTDMSKLVIQRAEMAKTAGCTGVVCSGREVQMIKEIFGRDFVAITPGIRPEWGEAFKDDQHRIVTPAEAIKRGSDYLVIGRPIRDAEDPVVAAQYIAEEIESSLGES